MVSKKQTVLRDTWPWTVISSWLCEFTRDSLFVSLAGRLWAPCKFNEAYLQVQIFRKGVIVHKNNRCFRFPIEGIIFVRSRIFIFCFRKIAGKQVVVCVSVAVPLHDFLEIDVHSFRVSARRRLDFDANRFGSRCHRGNLQRRRLNGRKTKKRFDKSKCDYHALRWWNRGNYYCNCKHFLVGYFSTNLNYLHNEGADSAAKIDENIIFSPVESLDDLVHLRKIRLAISFGSEWLILI